MYLNSTIRLLTFVLILLWNSLYSFQSHALTHQSKQWTDLKLNGDLLKNPKLLYNYEMSSRSFLEPVQFETEIIRGAIGYQYFQNVSFWLGYQWNSHNQISGSRHINLGWQQILWLITNTDQLIMQSRSRFEERTQAQQPDWNYRFRQLLRFQLSKFKFNNMTPIVSNELFINLNQPIWISNKTFDQNRAFIGLNIPTSQSTFIELGYLNQYEWKKAQNQSNNVLYLSINVNT